MASLIKNSIIQRLLNAIKEYTYNSPSSRGYDIVILWQYIGFSDILGWDSQLGKICIVFHPLKVLNWLHKANSCLKQFVRLYLTDCIELTVFNWFFQPNLSNWFRLINFIQHSLSNVFQAIACSSSWKRPKFPKELFIVYINFIVIERGKKTRLIAWKRKNKYSVDCTTIGYSIILKSFHVSATNTSALLKCLQKTLEKKLFEMVTKKREKNKTNFI